MEYALNLSSREQDIGLDDQKGTDYKYDSKGEIGAIALDDDDEQINSPLLKKKKGLR